MQAATNKPETEEENIPAKSAEEAQEEYNRLLKEYQRLKDEIETEVRRMRGGRVLNLREILARILKPKSRQSAGPE
jgi:hypothetical protein